MKLYFEDMDSNYKLIDIAERIANRFISDYPQYTEKDKIKKLARSIANNKYDTFLDNLQEEIYKALQVYGRGKSFK